MAEHHYVGGRFDGMVRSSTVDAPYIWFDGKKAFRKSGKGRELYKHRRKRRDESVVYEFVGHVMTLCGCGVYRKKRKGCDLCGEGSP